MPTRLIAAILLVAVALSGCAHRAAGSRAPAVPVPDAGAGAQQAARRDPDVWRRYVRSLAPGTRVRMELVDGRRITGTLMGLEDDAIVVQPRTRLPEPARVIALDRVAWLEPDTGGIGAGRAIAIGVLSGAASFLALMLVTFALISD
jgi:hypothetical protein